MMAAGQQVQGSRLGQCTDCETWDGSGRLQKAIDGQFRGTHLLDSGRGSGVFVNLVGRWRQCRGTCGWLQVGRVLG